MQATQRRRTCASGADESVRTRALRSDGTCHMSARDAAHARLAIAHGLQSHATRNRMRLASRIRMRLAFARGSYSHAACDRMRLAIASATQARAHLGHHDLSRDVVESWELARFLAPTALGQRHRVRSEQAVCELAHISASGQASGESAGHPEVAVTGGPGGCEAGKCASGPGRTLTEFTRCVWRQ